MLALQNLKKNMKMTKIASLLKVYRGRVHQWARRLLEEGIDGLKELLERGRKAKLFKKEMLIVSNFIKERSRSIERGLNNLNVNFWYWYNL